MRKVMKNVCLLAVALAALAPLAKAQEKVRVACVGDSISKNRNAMGGRGWPLYLGKLLGGSYDVRTFSANGVVCLRAPTISVWRKSEIKHAAAFKPNVVIIMLGTNMGKKGHHHFEGRYAGDYRALIAHFKRLPSKPKVYVCTPIPVYRDNYGIQGKFVHEVITPIIRKIAKDDGLPLIDTYTPLKGKKGICTDGIHPSIKGMQAIAAIAYKGLIGKEPPAETVAALAEEYKAAERKKRAAETKKKKAQAKTTTGVMAWLAQRSASDPKVVVLKVADVRDIKGDGPDGKGNTADDKWGFWFELAHGRGTFARLRLATATMTDAQRKNGIKRKIYGPIGSWLPNPKDTEGWIYKSDWDGRFEGAWGDTKADQVIMYPYVEKGSHCSVALTYQVAVPGTYTVSGKVTDLQVHPQFKRHDGAAWKIEVADGGKRGKLIAKGGPFGDGHGRPDSAELKAEKFAVERGQLIRLVIHPNRWWGSDMTKVELRIERVDTKD